MDDPMNPPPARPLPQPEHLQPDIALANQYRLEFIKHTMSIAAGVFVFTITFRKDIIGTATPKMPELAAIAWAFMILSLLGGLGHMAGWDRFYISYRDYKKDLDAGDIARKSITMWRRIAMWLQLVGLIVGMACITVYCIANL